MSVVNNLRVLHWNCNGIDATKKSDISSFLSEHSIDILSLNENHQTRPNISSFRKLYHQQSKDLIVYIRQNISFRIIHKSTSSEFDFIVIAIDQSAFIFCYLRHGNAITGISKLYEIIMEVQHNFRKFTIIGDLNARLSLLSNPSRNSAGVSLENYLSEEDSLIVLNEPNVYTFKRLNPHSALNYSYSVIDLCLVSHALLGKISRFQVLNHQFGSDHYPVFIEIGLGKFIDPNVASQYFDLFPLRKYALQSLSYPETFSSILDVSFRNLSYSYQSMTSENLWESIKKCFYCGLKQAKLLKARNASSLSNLRLPQEILALRYSDRNAFKRALNQFKVDRWRNFIASIQDEDSLQHVWRKFRLSRGLPQTSLRFGDQSIEAENIMEQFRLNCIPDIPLSSRHLNFNLQVILDTEDPFSSFNGRITMLELLNALQKCSNGSSPGPDGLPYSIFKQLSMDKKEIILSLLNKFFDDGDIPENLKHCLQIAMPKPSGDYRPISLMNCFLKIYETILYERLYVFIDSLLPDSQFGFRKCRSAYDQAANLIMHIQNERAENKLVGVIFIDIKKAFDRVDRSDLLSDLFECGVKGKILRALNSIINGFTMRVLFENFVSSEYQPECGTPQGSILSPLLWNFYFRKFDSNLQHSLSFGFADDLALLHSHHNHSSLISNLSSDFQRLNVWCFGKRIEISSEKSKFVDFSKTFRKRKITTPGRITFRNLFNGNISFLEQVSSYKYLGVILDEQLTFKLWTDYIVSQVYARTAAISRISSTVRLPRDLIEKFYLGYVRGFLNYASCIWSHIGKTQLDRITIADRKGLRLCCGALLRTPTPELEEESKLFPLHELSLRSTLRQGCRLLFTFELKHALLITESCSNSDLSKKWLEAWNFFHLPRCPNIISAIAILRRASPARPKLSWKYHGDFWIERLLARTRMGVLPTREWAASMKLTDSPRCRHCLDALESIDHLLSECYVIERSALLAAWPPTLGNFSFESLRILLKNPRHPNFTTFQKAFIEFVRNNNLFKRF
jgi:hypothetical protein